MRHGSDLDAGAFARYFDHMHKRLFLHFGAASLGSTLAGCLATAPTASDTGAAAASSTSSGAGPAPDPAWEALRTPATGIPTHQAQQSARLAFERVANGQAFAGTSAQSALPAQSLRQVAAAQDSMDRALADFARRWPSISPQRRQTAMARDVTPSVAQTMRQMMLTADKQVRPTPAPTVVTTAPEVEVPPGAGVRFNIKGYCLDAGLPAPVKGDQAYLAPVDARVIAPALAPLYEGAAAWAAKASKTDGLYPLAQQVYWALAHAGTNNHWAKNPAPDVRRAMDQITPGGYKIFESYHTTELAKREVLKAVLKQSGLDRYIGADQIARGDYAGAVTRALEQQIAQGSRMPSQKGQGYSWLAPGVAARITGSGPLAMDMEIINTSGQPFRFVPANYIAQPADRKQPVALPARLTGITTTSFSGASPLAALQRLFTDLGEKLATFVSQPLFGGAFDWMLQPARIDMTMSRTWAALQDLDRRYPLKAAIGAMPVIGNSLSLYEGFFGKDWLTGSPLSNTERAIALAATMPGEATIVQGLKILERSGALKALEKVPGLDQFARDLPGKVYDAIDSTVFQAGWVPVRGAMRNARNENNANASAGTSALLDENVNPLQMLGNPGTSGFGLPSQVVAVFRQESPSWSRLMGLN